jgi:hypothetical protein
MHEKIPAVWVPVSGVSVRKAPFCGHVDPSLTNVLPPNPYQPFQPRLDQTLKRRYKAFCSDHLLLSNRMIGTFIKTLPAGAACVRNSPENSPAGRCNNFRSLTFSPANAWIGKQVHCPACGVNLRATAWSSGRACAG